MTKNETEEGRAINILLDGPPGYMPGRFAGVETDEGLRINAGKWAQREDGLWALRITELPAKVKKSIIIHKLPVNTLVEVWSDDRAKLHEKRYWKCYGDGLVKCFTNGKTSQTENSTSTWHNYHILDNPWMAWRGGECPVAPWVKVQVLYRSGRTPARTVEAKCFDWTYPRCPLSAEIVNYKIVEQEVPKWSHFLSTEPASPVECLVVTRRDYFAAAALQGLIANSFQDGINQPLSLADNKEIAAMARDQADHLINALAL